MCHVDDDETLYSVSIITTEACASLEWLHFRMPVILDDDSAVERWLGDSQEEWSNLAKLLRPLDADDLSYHPVTPEMGSVKFQGEKCCKDIRKKGLGAFFAPTKRRSKTTHEPAGDDSDEEMQTRDATGGAVSGKKIKREAKVKNEEVKNKKPKIEVKKEEEDLIEQKLKSPVVKRETKTEFASEESSNRKRDRLLKGHGSTSPLRKSARLIKKLEKKE